MIHQLKKILNADQIREADQYTIQNEPIPSIDLMERASQAFVNTITSRISKNQQIVVVCGTGNNGGDGLAVARILLSEGYAITPVLIKFSEHLSPDCATNLNRLSAVTVVTSPHDIPDFSSYDVIIDAIFGSGLTRPIAGLAGTVVNQINKANKLIYAIDVPSGIYCDHTSNEKTIVQADLTVSFQRPKLAFFFPDYGEFIKEWTVVDIGLDEAYIQDQDTPYYVLDNAIAKSIMTRKKYSHKGTYGHALLIAGAYGKIGASVLASKACLRSGAGLLTTYVPKCGYTILQTAVPEAMCLTDKHDYFITTSPDLSLYNAIGVGPGIGTAQETKAIFNKLFKAITHQKLVIDADGLNILSKDKKLLKQLPKDTILTPHPKEFERLVGKWGNSEERLQLQQQFAKKYQCIVILKDAHTSITDPKGNTFFNTSGNPGMATGGSGDVLTGIITGLLAQSYAPLEAALIGVYFHGIAGDRAAKQLGKNALIASDIISNLRIEIS